MQHNREIKTKDSPKPRTEQWVKKLKDEKADDSKEERETNVDKKLKTGDSTDDIESKEGDQMSKSIAFSKRYKRNL